MFLASLVGYGFCFLILLGFVVNHTITSMDPNTGVTTSGIRIMHNHTDSIGVRQQSLADDNNMVITGG